MNCDGKIGLYHKILYIRKWSTIY